MENQTRRELDIMNAFQQFLTDYAAEGVEDWIWPHIEACAREGVVILSPDAVGLARPVHSSTPIEDLDRVTTNSDLPSSPDSWHVLYAAGDLRELVTRFPRPLPFVLWTRKGRFSQVKRWNFETFIRHVIAQTKSST